MLRYVTRPGTTTELVVLQVILAAIWLATSTPSVRAYHGTLGLSPSMF